jgi:putative transposase
MSRQPAPTTPGFYHIVSRVIRREPVLNEATSEFFVKVLHGYVRLLGFDLITYCLVPHHFHLLVYLPEKPKKNVLSIQQWGDLLMHAISPQSMDQIRQEIEPFLRNPKSKEAREWLQDQIKTRYSISELLRRVKMRVGRWYNWKYQSTGQFWEGRFECKAIQSEAVPEVAAAIDLLPVRAGIVTDPADYRWCGYAAALATSPAA